MKLSNDQNVVAKVIYGQVVMLIVLNFVTFVFALNTINPRIPCLTVAIVTIPLAAFLCKYEMRKIATDVFWGDACIYYRKGGISYTLPKGEIKNVSDSGFNSWPYELILETKQQGRVVFFPNESKSDFFKGKTKKALKAWIGS